MLGPGQDNGGIGCQEGGIVGREDPSDDTKEGVGSIVAGEVGADKDPERRKGTGYLHAEQTSDTYVKKAAEYEGQAQAAAAIIIRLRQEKQEANARAQVGVDRIRLIMSASRD